MKIPTLLCAGACVLLLAGGAAAHDTGKPHKHHSPEGADGKTRAAGEAEGSLRGLLERSPAARRRRSATTAVVWLVAAPRARLHCGHPSLIRDALVRGSAGDPRHPRGPHARATPAPGNTYL